MLPQLAEPVSAMYDPDRRRIDADLKRQAASTTVAEAERPPIAVVLELVSEATDGNVYSAWVAENPDAEPVLVVAYNPRQYPRSVVDRIVARRHGVPVEVVELELKLHRESDTVIAGTSAAIQQIARAAIIAAAEGDESPLPAVRAGLVEDLILTAVVETSAEEAAVLDRAQGLNVRDASDAFLSAASHLIGETLARAFAEARAAGADEAAAVKNMRRVLHTLVDLSADDAQRGGEGEQ